MSGRTASCASSFQCIDNLRVPLLVLMKERMFMSSSVINQPRELHACMGLNACKGHDRLGTNACAGSGICATAAEHSCQTLNHCRGQGGCGLYGTGEEQNHPGENPC